ncbi:helix-turn-helix domain-containing protein [Herminiimonas contaminans]|uniref:Helix-turn-helix transcriptional regulator n=1 Tax=Herminiimonas contaminans TaxID=1111140 RepID=A0ABS0EX33_9BURK|nr:helix-turn-helix transcriptional regulator [Herminiimonas contaminans]MBF8179411.1 helix-turn-helix transcriptional regulator [Herminiimonas contaminans]
MKITHLDIDVDQWLGALGCAIRNKRKELGLSQEELAHLIQIDRSHMGRIERGERNLTFANILKISAGLKCSPSALLMLAGL